jgi:adenylate kinase
MKNHRLAVIMLGPPGAGKGTQARILSESLKVPHISTGDILREALKNETELGKKAKAFMESGGLVPDEIVDAIVAERVKRKDCRLGFILDGYPRTIPQAEFLRSVLEKDKTEILTVGIEVGEEALIPRLSSRWTCPKCGKMFNANLNPEKAGGQCDECRTGLIQRKDDTAEVIAERLRVYKKKTEPLIQYYKSQGAYIEINGDRPVNVIFEAIISVVVQN